MEQTKLFRNFVEELWARAATVDAGRASLRLKLPGGDELHVEQSAAADRIRVRYYVAQPDGALVKDLAVVFAVTPSNEWMPIEFYRAKTGRRLYVLIDERTGEMTLMDAPNQRACAAYCDGWSFHLRAQGWLEKGVVT